MATSFRRSQTHTAIVHAPNPAAGHHRPTPLPEIPGPRASLGQSLVGSLLLSLGSECAPGSVCAFQESSPPVLCKLWQPCGGVKGDLLHESLCRTYVYGTQRPYLCSSLLLAHISSGGTQTPFCLSPLGSLRPGAHKAHLSPLRVTGGYGVCFYTHTHTRLP